MGTIQLSPPAAPFSRIKNPGESITINTAGKVLVIPTGNAALLPSFNEYTLNSNRLTIAESPFGGLKGAGSPDYGVGTVFVTSGDGIYITDTAGTNSTKTMTAGKLKELSLLTVNTTLKTVTEDFVIANTNTSNTPLTLDDCNSLAPGWTLTTGSNFSQVGDGSKVTITVTTDGTGLAVFNETIASQNLTNYPFLNVLMKCSHAGSAYLGIGSGSSNYVRWLDKNCDAITANTDSRFVLPIKAPLDATVTTANPNANSSPTWSAVTYLRFGFKAAAYPNTAITITLYDISADVGKAANVEIQVPDNLADPSLTLQCWDGSAYQTCRVCKLNSTFADVSTTPANAKLLDGTKLDDIYGSALGRGVFPKSVSGATVTGNNSLTTTYSGNKGTKYRIGKMVMLPPSDGGRTNFNKIRLKLIINYTDVNGNSIPDLSGNGKTGTITGTVVKKIDGIFYDSVDDRVTIPVVNSLLSALGYTVVVEVTPTDFSTYYYDRHIISAMSSDGFHFRVGNGKLNFVVIETGGTTVAHAGVATLTAGTKYILIMTLTPTVLKGYINGVLDNTTNSANSWNIIPTTAPIIGNYAGDTARVFHGTVHNVAFFNGVWDQAQITAYINSKTTPTNPVFRMQPIAQNMGATTYEFEDSNNASYGLQNMTKPWIALYDPTGNYIDFFLFTHRPKNLIRRRDDSGNVYELTISPGNGAIYRGRITHANLNIDSNTDLIPDGLNNNSENFITSDSQTFLVSDSSYFDVLTQSDGSISKFLSSYGMVI